MNDTAGGVDTEIKESATTEPSTSGVPKRVWLFLRRHARRIFYFYVVVLLLVTSFQAVCILLLLRPSHEWAQYWASFGRDFATSPAAAGMCAVLAAWIGATQLSRQLTQNKKKAAEEAWWQQFEWATDRLIPTHQKGEKEDKRLPLSLGFELMTALSRSATETFQRAAVAGILNHYLKDFEKQPTRTPDQGETPTPTDPTTNTSDSPTMDPEAAEALRYLIDELPVSSRARARTVLQAYHDEYEREVVKALQHRFSDAVQTRDPAIPGADATIQLGSQKAVIEVKESAREANRLRKTASEVKSRMNRGNASIGVIITPPTSLNVSNPVFKGLSADGIHLIEWEPSLGSSALHRNIRSLFDPDHSASSLLPNAGVRTGWAKQS